MLRSVSWLVLPALLGCLAIASAGDKLPDQTLLSDAKEDVAQALLAESQGDNAARTKRLTKAWLAAPELAEANWHLARIRVAGQWRPLAEMVSSAANDPDQEQYRALRERAAGNPKALRDLARWCAKLGWHDRARLHYTQLLSDPQADAEQKSEAVEKLNLVQVNGAWLTKDEFEARQEEAKAIQESLAKWRPRLKSLQQIIDGDDFAKRDKAIAELAKLDDPTMIAALESFLLDAKGDFQEHAVKKLAEFPHFEASQAVTRYAVLSEYSIARNAAIEALKKRPEHEYVPLLLDGLIAPIKSQFQVTWDRSGKVNYVHAVMTQGPSSNFLLVTHRLALPDYASSGTLQNSVKIVPKTEPANVKRTAITTGPTAGEAFADQRARLALTAANAQTRINLLNSQRDQHNRWILDALTSTTSQQYEGPVEWWSWWQEHNGYSWPKPTKYLYDYKPYAYTAAPSIHRFTTGTSHVPVGSCFLAGTPVRAEIGTVPIESIKPGDRVLTQDQDTGELAYKVVLKTTLRPPAKMVEIKAGGENLYTTLGHPFWVAGRGWQMAKQLKAGDLLHGLAGATPIESINAAGEHAAHNLVVDDTNTYFVGRSGFLVHDNEFRKPTRAIVPGLARD